MVSGTQRHQTSKAGAASTRRQILVASVAGLGGIAGAAPPAAGNTGCDAIQQLLGRIAEERRSVATWASSVGPAHSAQLESRLGELERATNSARAEVDERSKERWIASLNAAGSVAVLLAGVSLAAVPGASAGIFAASLAFFPGLLVMQAATAPRSVSGLEVAQNVALDRLGSVLSVAGDRAYAMTTASARLLGPAAHVVSFTSACFATANAAKAWRSFGEARAELENLERRVREAREALVALRAGNTLRTFRENCLDALGAEAVPAAQRLCPVSLPRRN